MSTPLLEHLASAMSLEAMLQLAAALRTFGGKRPPLARVAAPFERAHVARRLLDAGRTRAQACGRLELDYSISHRQALRDVARALQMRQESRVSCRGDGAQSGLP